jgi:hypothetical protein
MNEIWASSLLFTMTGQEQTMVSEEVEAQSPGKCSELCHLLAFCLQKKYNEWLQIFSSKKVELILLTSCRCCQDQSSKCVKCLEKIPYLLNTYKLLLITVTNTENPGFLTIYQVTFSTATLNPNRAFLGLVEYYPLANLKYSFGASSWIIYLVLNSLMHQNNYTGE